MFSATTINSSTSPLFGHPFQLLSDNHKFLSNPINSIRIIAPFVLISSDAFFLQVCQMHSWCLWGRLVAFKFLQGEEAVRAWLSSIISCLSPRTLGKLHRIFLLYFLDHPQVIRVSPDLQSHLQLGYH